MNTVYIISEVWPSSYIVLTLINHYFTCFQKNPFFLFHLHLILLRPNAILPGSQMVMQDEFWHVIPATPAGRGFKSGHNSQFAEDFTPTGKPQSSFLDLALFRYQNNIKDFIELIFKTFIKSKLLCRLVDSILQRQGMMPSKTPTKA